MPLTIGSRLESYEILSLLGAGGIGARGHAEAAAMGRRGRGISVSSRRGWGPAASEKMLAPSPSRSNPWR